MEISTKQLKIQSDKIISQVSNGQEITIIYRGKASAKIVPIANKKKSDIEIVEDELFGLWANRKDSEDVEQYIRNMRKGRKL